MSDKIPRRNFLKLSTLGIGAIGLAAASCDSNSQAQDNTTLLIDVCCDQNTIRFEGPSGPNPDNPADVGPHPYYGASFVVQGVIYLAGTLNANPNSGLLPDGTPEFPGDVIGNWICRGWFIGDSNDPARGGIFTPTGPFVATNQIYDLNPSTPGSELLTSDGIELIDLNVPFSRAVTGGTGPRNGASGNVTQTGIGVNQTGLFNFTFEFNLI